MPFNSAQPTLQNQINVLKSKVSAAKPETKYFNREASTLNAATGVHQFIIRPTEVLIADADFRELINGSKWTNMYLRLGIAKPAACNLLRTIVYVPKRPGNTIDFGANFLAFSKIPDASQVTVLSDTTMQSTYGQQFNNRQINVNLKKMRTMIADGGTTIEKGDIKIYIVLNNSTGVTNDLAFISWRLTFHDNP
jgi:hypothetical protein